VHISERLINDMGLAGVVAVASGHAACCIRQNSLLSIIISVVFSKSFQMISGERVFLAKPSNIIGNIDC